MSRWNEISACVSHTQNHCSRVSCHVWVVLGIHLHKASVPSEPLKVPTMLPLRDSTQELSAAPISVWHEMIPLIGKLVQSPQLQIGKQTRNPRPLQEICYSVCHPKCEFQRKQFSLQQKALRWVFWSAAEYGSPAHRLIWSHKSHVLFKLSEAEWNEAVVI